MGTRSTYRVIEQFKDEKTGKVKENKLVLVYVQYDGYPDGHPLETAEWLAGGKVVNGIGMNDTGLIFNGAGCLAAQLISRLKGDSAGNTYIHPLTHRGKCGEDYTYDIIIRFEDKSITYVAYNNPYNGRPKELFRGTPAEYVAKYQKIPA